MKRAPWMKRKIAGIKAFASPRGVLFFAQRRVRKTRSRQRLSHYVARFLPAPGAPTPDAIQLTRELDQQGFAMVDGLVTPAMAQEMHNYFRQQPVMATYDLDSKPVSIDSNDLPDSHTFQAAGEVVVACPHVLDVANDPRVISAVEGIFGCKPTIGYMSAWWSVPTSDGVPRQAENFHRDYDDVNFIKFFIYLTDVETANGPHEFIRGSHKEDTLRDIARYSDEQVMSACGQDKLVVFTGGAGSAFLENTTGLHRGQPVRTGRRLVLQIVYSMLPMAYGPAAPYGKEQIFAPRQKIDPYINRIYVAA